MGRDLVLDAPECARESDRLSIERIRRSLVTDQVGFQMYLFGAVASTNDLLRRLAVTGTADGTVVLAEAQTLGRGRLGQPWFSPPGLNLYASVLFRRSLRPAAVPVFAFIASLAVTEAIWSEGVPARIKWPNDVLIEGRKVAGTLVTYGVKGDLVDYVVLGVGVNLNVDRFTLSGGLGPAAPAATSLREAAGHPIDRNAFTAAFLNFLEKWDEAYQRRGPATVLAAWRERDALARRIVEVIEPGATYRGTARGVDDDGRLVVVDALGARREVLNGEIRIVA